MKRTIVLVATLAVAGCAATVKDAVPIGGSKADGTVKLAYEVGPFQQAEIDWDKAQQEAIKRCSAWDYSDAESFGTPMSLCVAHNQYGCVKERVEMTYQCTG